MGIHAAMWATKRHGLKSGEMWILTRAALSCDDVTGKLKWRPERLAAECRISIRSLETHLPRLMKLQLLARADEGFRVVGWVIAEKISEKFSEKKESIKERKEILDLDFKGSTPLDKPEIGAREAAEAFNSAVIHYRKYHSEFSEGGFVFDAPDLDERILDAVYAIGGWYRIGLLAQQPRDFVFARKEFMHFYREEVFK